MTRPALTISGLVLLALNLLTIANAESFRVVSVVEGQAASSAGILADDRLSAWRTSKSTASVSFDGLFDLYHLEIRLGSAGPVVVEGLRGDEPMSWIIASGRWGIEAWPESATTLEQAVVNPTSGDASDDPEEAPLLLIRQLAARQQWVQAAWLAQESIANLSVAGGWVEAEAILEWATGPAVSHLPVDDYATLLEQIAADFERHSDPDITRRLLRQAIAMRDKPPVAPMMLANALERLGAFDARRGEIEAANSNLDRALTVLQPNGADSLVAVRVWNSKGTAQYASGAYDEAVTCYQRAVSILETRGGPVDEMASPLGNLGTLAAIRGDLGGAEQLYNRALEIKQRNPEDRVIPALLNNLGIIAKQRGDLLGAEQYYQRALAINERRQAWVSYNTNLFNLADLASDQDDIETATLLLRRALASFQSQNDRSPAVAQTLGELAGLELRQGHFQKAEALYKEAAALYAEVASESVDYAFILRGLGDVARDAGRMDEAARYYEEAIEWRRNIAPQSIHIANTKTALAAILKGDPAGKRQLLEALKIHSAVAPGSIAEAETRFALAQVEAQEGTPEVALINFEAAVSAIEYQTQRLGGADDTRSRFNDKYSHYFKRYIEVLLAQDEPEAAFNVLERYRARSLLAMLAERDIAWNQDVPQTLLDQRRQLDRDYDQAQADLLDLGESRAAPEALESARVAVLDLKRKRDSLAGELRAAAPQFASLTYPQPLDLGQVQQTLSSDTAVLSYSVHDEGLNLFVVTADSMQIFSADITRQTLSTEVERFRKLIALGRFEPDVTPEFVALSSELFDQLLRPALDAVTAKRFLIVPDGPLHLLPFAALIDSQSESAAGIRDWRYLIEIAPHRLVLSLTLHQHLREQATYSSSSPVDARLVAFGDPVFSPTDDPASARTRIDLVAQLAQLPGSRKEVEAVAALYEPEARAYLGAAATEQQAKALSGRVSYLHFATHGLLNERMPLDSALVLSAPTHEEGENGLLQTWEVFEDIRLNVDLVILSACETGIGRNFGGEGMIGLTRAFHHAGARAVLTSLWQVADSSTATLMTRFHGYLIKGVGTDEALQAAQLSLIAEGESGWLSRAWRSIRGAVRYDHPFFWASFQLHGDPS